MLKQLITQYLNNRHKHESPLHPLIKMDAYKLIYFPIPKAACSSLKFVCAQLLNFDRLLELKKDHYALHSINFPSMPREKLPLCQDYFKFSCVRNPWDRLVSCYKSKIKSDPGYNDIHFQNGIIKGFVKYNLFKAGMPFEDFVEAVLEIPDSESDFHFRSQHNFIFGDNETLLVDFLARFENLKHDYFQLSKTLGVSLPELPKLNTSSSKHYSSFYHNGKVVKKVSYRYAKDIELLNYKFESLDR